LVTKQKKLKKKIKGLKKDEDLLCCWSVRFIDERQNEEDEALMKFTVF